MGESLFPGKESRQCNALTKRGTPCHYWAVPGMEKCRFHGGLSPKGIEHYKFVHGRYSKHLPKNLSELFETALSDPNLTRLRDDIALMDARLAQMFQKLDHMETAAAWIQVGRSFAKLRRAQAEEHEAVAAEAMNELAKTIEQGVGDLESWQEIHATVDQRRKLVADEHRQMIALKQTMTAEKAMALMAVVVDSIRRAVTAHCTDNKQANRILMDIQKDLATVSNLKDNPRLALSGPVIEHERG